MRKPNRPRLHKFANVCCAVIACCAIAVTIGCGASGPAVEMVTGVVNLDGSPCADATVKFIPVVSEETGTQEGVAAVGKTQSDGSFTLNAQGAPPGAGTTAGSYVVTIEKVEYPEVEEITEDDPRYGTPAQEEAERKAANAKPTFIVPKAYGFENRSGLTAEVGTPPNEFTFNLTSEFTGAE